MKYKLRTIVGRMINIHGRMIIVHIIGLCLATVVLPVQAQTAVQLDPDQSVGVLSRDPASGERWSTSTLPFGNYVGSDSGEDVFCRTYLRFPLDGVPANSTVQSATLYVYVDDFWPGAGGAPMSIYPVATAWTPGDVAWDDMGNWPTLEGSVATTDVSSTEGWYTWDVTSLVQGWLDGAPNHGLAIAAAALDSTADNWAAARRLTVDDADTRPYLDLTYVEPTPTPTSTPEPPPPPPPATATPPPPAATPTPLPIPTPTPEAVLLPTTGKHRPPTAGELLGIGGGLGLLVALTAVAWRTERP
jgi:hypothetical protein